jgi:predicted metal-dependent peptidase
MLEERKLQKAKITLMRSPKFALLQGVMMIGRTSVVDNIPTACTNGRDEKYGRAFVAALSDKELAFLVAHEVSHKMYRHLTTWTKLHDENPHLANVACDYVINLMLKELDPAEDIIAMPVYKDGPLKGQRMGMYDPKYKGMNSKQVFDLLKQEQEKNGGGGSGEGIDDHDWDGAKEMSDEDKKVLEREIDQAIRQGLMAHEKAHGKGGGGIGREIDEHLEPKINWREELREYVKATCSNKDTSSWRRVNRRFLTTGTYMPSMIGEKVGHIVVAIDTSGSIGGRELNEFLAEVKGVAEEVNPEIVDLIYWDGEVAGHEKYEGAEVSNIVSSTKPRGGGGTDPSCVSIHLRDNNIKPECVIVLTDGYVPNWGSEWTAPTMWVITGGNTNAVSDNGRTIHIKD